MRRREMVAAGEVPLIPADYQQVEYIESLSTAAAGPFFNTGYNPTMTGNLVLEVDCMAISYYSDTCYPVGVCQPGTSTTIAAGVYYQKDGMTVGAWNGASSLITSPTSLTNAQIKLVGTFDTSGNNSLSFNGTTATATAETFRSYNGLPVCLFGVKKRTSQQVSGPFRGRIYHAKITENGVVQRDLYPCYRKSDDAPGFFDVITKTFKARSGSSTTTISVGPEV